MARQTLIPTIAPGQYPTAGVALTETAEDATNHSQFLCTGREIVIARNTDSASHTVTINSVADQDGRTGDILTEAIPAGASHVYGPLAKTGWAQPTGYVNLQASDPTVKFSIVRVP